MIQVFRIVKDERYQFIYEVNWGGEHPSLTTAEAPLLENWQPYEMFVDKPAKRRGDFLFLPLEYMVCRPELAAGLSDCIEGDVQQLPVRIKDDPSEFLVWNITNFLDVLNLAQTKYRYPPTQEVCAGGLGLS
ncbi:hypothetical protein ACFPN2_09365 [Steroidobacter flavus]|uniref:Uncharacterized protein n=1 Tax=Steroidobacter flavus TaxID=1842136 RepID=A0ABV8SQN4_9GAMM